MYSQKQTPEEKQYRHNLYARVYTAKQRIKELERKCKAEASILPKNMELQAVLRRYYKVKIEKAEEHLSVLLMDYYSL